MQNIRLNKQVFYGPARWDELTAETLLQVAAITSAEKFKRMIPYYLVLKLFKIPVALFKKLKQCQFIQLEVCLEWMAGKNTLSKWVITRLSIRGRKYYGPKSRLADLTVEEFMFAEGAYTRWLDDQDHNTLDTLFAALFRRHSFWHGRRLEFNDHRKEQAATAAKFLLPHVKKAIALNYAGCRNLIIDKHPNVWKADTDQGRELLKPKDMQRVNWPALALELSGDKFGTYNQTIKMNLWLFLADMDKKAKRNAEMEARL